MSNLPGIPSPPAGIDSSLRCFLDALSEALQVRIGQRGDPLDAAITFRDLVDIGVARLTDVSVANGAGVDLVQPATADVDLSPPPAPSGLTSSAAFQNIMLSWTFPSSYTNLAHFQVWRSATNDRAAALQIATTAASVFTDSVGLGKTYYYWVRANSKESVVGDWNAGLVSGVMAGTGLIGGVDLGNLIVMAANIANGAIDLNGTKITGTLSDPARFGAAVIGSAAIQNGAILNAKIGDLAVDAAKIANLAVSEAKIASAAITEAKIANASITNAKIGSAAVDTFNLAGNSVTVPVSSIQPPGLVALSTSYVAFVSATIDSVGQPVSVTVSVPYYISHFTASPGNAVQVRVMRDSTELFPIDGSLGWAAAGGAFISGTSLIMTGTVSLTIKDNPGYGAHTYMVLISKYSASGYVAAWNTSIQLLGVKR